MAGGGAARPHHSGQPVDASARTRRLISESRLCHSAISLHTSEKAKYLRQDMGHAVGSAKMQEKARRAKSGGADARLPGRAVCLIAFLGPECSGHRPACHDT